MVITASSGDDSMKERKINLEGYGLSELQKKTLNEFNMRIPIDTNYGFCASSDEPLVTLMGYAKKEGMSTFLICLAENLHLFKYKIKMKDVCKRCIWFQDERCESVGCVRDVCVFAERCE